MSVDAGVAFLPDRLNRAPAVFLGLTDGELRLAGLANLAFFVPAGAAAAALVGQAVLGIGAGALAAGGGIWLTARVLRRLKRGRPEGYHADAVAAWLEDRGLKPKTMLRESAVWDVRARRRRGRRR